MGSRLEPHVSCLRLVTVFCVAVVVGLGGGSASAQNCFLFFCQEQPRWQGTPLPEPEGPSEGAPPFSGGLDRQYVTMYAAINGEPFPVPALRLSDVDPTYLRTSVHYRTCIAAYGFLISKREAIPPSAPRCARPFPLSARYPTAIDPEAPLLRPERHIPNSIATVRRRLIAALVSKLQRCPCCAVPIAKRMHRQIF